MQPSRASSANQLNDLSKYPGKRKLSDPQDQALASLPQGKQSRQSTISELFSNTKADRSERSGSETPPANKRSKSSAAAGARQETDKIRNAPGPEVENLTNDRSPPRAQRHFESCRLLAERRQQPTP